MITFWSYLNMNKVQTMIHALIIVLLTVDIALGEQYFLATKPFSQTYPIQYQSKRFVTDHKFLSDKVSRHTFSSQNEIAVASDSAYLHQQQIMQPIFYLRPLFSSVYPPAITPLFLVDYGSDDLQTFKHHNGMKTHGKANRNMNAELNSLVRSYSYTNHVNPTIGDSTESGNSKISMIHRFPEETLTAGVLILNRNFAARDAAHCVLEGNQVRYDPVTGGCFTVGTKGPCGDFMIFTTMTSDNLNGYCDCDYDSFDRPMALVRGQCHFLYTQANCFPGYWLTSLTPNSEPVCEKNPCHNSIAYRTPSHSILSTSTKNLANINSIIMFKGECIPLHMPSRHCRREGEVVLFPKGSTQPACGLPKSTKRIHRRQISNVSRFTCAPGMRRHRITKKCIRSRAIVFNY